MQVRARGPACGTHIAYQLALAYLVALVQAFGIAALVCVQRAVAVVVLQDDGIAIASFRALEFDNAVGGCMYGGAAASGVVNATVPTPSAVHRVLAHPEGGADACELERSTQERAFQAGAVEIVVAA